MGPAKALRCCLLGLLLLAGSAVPAATGDLPTLQRLRAERRQAARERNLAADKSASAGRFGLLVIPVDFADARLPGGAVPDDLSARLFAAGGESLHNYFRIASGGRLDLDITLVAPVHLPDTRRLYSDRDLNGFTRTRRLASEALAAVRARGLAFRRLDNDGPDGRPGTADDDGEVDGVLILHAGIGQENDPAAGLVQALQFFLAEPVVDDGVTASFYAVASLHSGPGIWAHETAHLLGMEDRYDPLLHPPGASEVRSVGGLGRFSLMAAGAWGTGDGYGAALPDAYSAAQLGWYRVRNLAGTGGAADTLGAGLAGGEVARVWRRGEIGPEYFLLETRAPELAAPFDAALPAAGHLLVYHIDETVAEGNWREDGPYQWHLRARLVEADGNVGLALGEDDGNAGDLFPGSANVTSFGPFTIPSSSSYADGATRLSLTSLTPVTAGVTCAVAVDTERSLRFSYGFTDDEMDLVVTGTGVPLGAVSGEIRVTSTPAYGYFADSGSLVADFPLTETSPGVWVPAAPVVWVPLGTVPAGAATQFRFRFYNATVTYGTETRTWVWRDDPAALDFRLAWPGDWVIEHPGGNLETTWQRWDARPWSTGDPDGVLVCTSADQTDGAAWPGGYYGNGAYTTLTSRPLGGSVRGVRLTHAIEVEMLTGTTAMDGGVVGWVGPDDREVAATPREGYGGSIDARSTNPLHGRAAFTGADLVPEGTVPLWRTATFVVPDDGPGPWRLRLTFGANSIWRARGWFIADLEALGAAEAATAFLTAWDGDLSWTWPWPVTGAPRFAVQYRTDAAAPWATLLDEAFAADGDAPFSVPGARILAGLPGPPGQRCEVRVVGDRPAGKVAGPSVVVYPDGGAAEPGVFGRPWPNPSTGTVRFLLDLPSGRSGVLRVYDLRGRLVHAQPCAAGRRLVEWDGRTAAGGRVAAGTYFLRLEGSGPVLTRKVVLLH